MPSSCNTDMNCSIPCPTKDIEVLKRWLEGSLLPLALIGLWEWAAIQGWLVAESVSHPSAIAKALVQVMMDGSLWTALAQTLGGAASGWLIASLAGTSVGVAFGLSRRLSKLMALSVETMRPIPSVALIPLALLIHGYGFKMEGSIVAFSSFWPVLIITESAVRGIEPRLLEVSKMLHLSLWQQTSKIILPAALPRIFVGLRLAAAVALVVAVTVEITANPQGLGYALIVAQESMRADRVFAFIAWIGLIGWGLNALLLRAQYRWFGRMGGWAETS
jgi:ABC-type nitrate/sulfonate/bicarbonate transport system permease component